MKRRVSSFLVLMIVILLFNVQVSVLVFAQDKTVTNLIIMIGDGMGIPQITIARVSSQGADGRLNLDKIKYTGLVTTHSANNLVTDSAAAGTALATGVKTNKGFIAVDPELKPLKSILILAQRLGKKVGLITTARITDATPATFGANTFDRQNEDEIAVDLIDNGIDLLMGGGLEKFGVDLFTREPKPGSLIKESEEKGYCFIDTVEKLKVLEGPQQKILALFNFGDMNFVRERFDFEPTLIEMTSKALEFLSNDKGFVLMIEGARIDDAGHLNDAEKVINEMVAFDETVGVVLDFASKSKNTLVIVTADHETGGMALNGGLLDGKNLHIAWTTGGHTGSMVPVYAFGPGAINFTGTHHLTEISRLMAEQLGIGTFPYYYE